ncbi:MAG TPA: valine--tRNA ligase, partial [Bacilli bacterium]|nr:valine--tRNA ligase [Bacilli bacterium]
KVFVDLFNRGLIYQGERIINWDIASKTALSNIEVIYEEEEASLYYYEYRLVDGSGSLVIATTRPETMFADQALMINPKDKRYLKYVGKEVYIPLTNIKIPIITDDYVDIKFGTGVVKVTPAHDPNDFEVGRRHNLAQPLCMNEDGTMNALAGKYNGMERFACRKQVLEDLKKEGYFRKIEKITHAIGHSERTGVIVEPRLSKQWFVKMDKLASDVLEMQNNPDEKVNFHPKRFERTFKQWLENIQDWCISRQLWWGHQIPVWYKGEEIYVGTEAPKGKGWTRDPDVLDTWFSSALWPFSTMGWPEITPDLKRYFPTDVLVTGYDIIFFWVARMVFQSKHFLNTRPFKGVLIHGIVRDEIGRKMSKSLGNGIVPEEMIDKYGVDSLRYFITTTVSLGEDLRFSQEKVEAAWNYINKIWNIARYIKIQFDNASYSGEEIDKKQLSLLDKWFITRLHKVIREVDPHFEKYNFGEAARAIYRFIWDDFASWYLEMTKVVFTKSTSKEKKINTCAVLNYGLKTILKLLHPFMPFFTEEIYQKYYSQSIVISSWPEIDKNLRFNIGDKMNIIFDIITNVRNIRAEYKIGNSKKIDLEFETKDQSIKKTIEENLEYLKRFCNYDNYQFLDKIDLKDKAVRVLKGLTMALPLKDLINFEEEKEKLNLEKTKLESEISRCEKMLENPNFVSK